ncbi:MAG: hypothetical protein HUU26_04775 [Gemmatimonadaceae bacterium]|nr:hypothetical protein [Gemmatimonadaceae bacterium]
MATTLTADQAFDVQVEVTEHVRGRRSTWVALAASLARFHAGRGWEALGIESFNEWIAQPEISLGRAEVYAMISAWRELVVERGVEPERLGELEITKVAVVLKSIKSRTVSIDDALSDCEVLSRSDLRAKYQDAEAAEYRLCEACGQRVKVTTTA